MHTTCPGLIPGSSFGAKTSKVGMFMVSCRPPSWWRSAGLPLASACVEDEPRKRESRLTSCQLLKQRSQFNSLSVRACISTVLAPAATQVVGVRRRHMCVPCSRAQRKGAMCSAVGSTGKHSTPCQQHNELWLWSFASIMFSKQKNCTCRQQSTGSAMIVAPVAAQRM